MHWESKHKQLKLTKDKSNNHHHHRDLLLKDMQKSVHQLVHYTVKEEPWVLLYNSQYLFTFLYAGYLQCYK